MIRITILFAVLIVLPFTGMGGALAQSGPGEQATAAVKVTVWRQVADPSLLYISTRPEGGRWRTFNTPLDMTTLGPSGRLHQSNAVLVQVRLEPETTVNVEVSVWRQVSDPSLLYVGARREGGGWNRLDTPVDMSALSRSGRFHQSKAVRVEAPVPENQPPMPTGAPQDILVSVGGAAWPFLASGLFRDADNDVAELSYTTTLSDPAVASVEVVVDNERHTAIIVTGTMAGSATIEVTATDPGGLSGERTLNVVVDDSGFTPLPGIKVDNNKIDLGNGFLTLTGTCTPPIGNTPFPSGLVVTINSSEWQTRSDSSPAWIDVPDTEVTTGQLCTYATRTPGEYRLVLDVTTVIDPHLPVLSGAFRAENTFIVEESTGGNRAPALNVDVPPAFDQLSVGGGPLFTEPTLFFTDPDGDDLAFSVALSDSAVIDAEIVTDVGGHRFLVATGTAAGSATLTLTATDPAGLSADLALEIDVNDEGLTPFPTIGVDNGVILLFGRSFGACLGPFNNTQVARYLYTVHSMKWQGRADASADWADIEGTVVTDGRLCPYTTDVAGDYRMVMELSVQPDEHVPALRGFYTAASTFTLSGGQ